MQQRTQLLFKEKQLQCSLVPLTWPKLSQSAWKWWTELTPSSKRTVTFTNNNLRLTIYADFYRFPISEYLFGLNTCMTYFFSYVNHAYWSEDLINWLLHAAWSDMNVKNSPCMMLWSGQPRGAPSKLILSHTCVRIQAKRLAKLKEWSTGAEKKFRELKRINFPWEWKWSLSHVSHDLWQTESGWLPLLLHVSHNHVRNCQIMHARHPGGRF